MVLFISLILGCANEAKAQKFINPTYLILCLGFTAVYIWAFPKQISCFEESPIQQLDILLLIFGNITIKSLNKTKQNTEYIRRYVPDLKKQKAWRDASPEVLERTKPDMCMFTCLLMSNKTYLLRSFLFASLHLQTMQHRILYFNIRQWWSLFGLIIRQDIVLMPVPNPYFKSDWFYF